MGSLLESFIGCLAVEAAVGPVVVVEVLPFLELVVEDLASSMTTPVEEAVELLGFDAMRVLDLAIARGRPGRDAAMADAFVQDMPVKACAELGPVVGLDDLDPEREPLQDIVQELDGRLLVELGVDAQHAQPGAIIDRGELVVLLALGRLGAAG